MRIGIDLDNTLVCYDNAFLIKAWQLGLIPQGCNMSRSELRKQIREKSEGEIAWQRLQGQVYGNGISHAQLFPGVYRFLWRCKHQGHVLEIVSHKTQYGHYDEGQTPLREVALEFLASKGLFEAGKPGFIDSVQFCDNKEEKVNWIVDRGFDCFIDDLPGILEDEKVPDEVKKVGFDPDQEGNFERASSVRTWREIEDLVLEECSLDEMVTIANEISSQKMKKGMWHEGGGNSQIVQLCLESDKRLALKVYADEPNRIKAEYEAFSLLAKCGEKRIPKGVQRDDRWNMALYEWVDGEVIQCPDSKDVNDALDLLSRFHKWRVAPDFRAFPNASASIFSGQELERQVIQRLAILRHNAGDFPMLSEYLDNELVPEIDKQIQKTKSRWSILAYEAVVPRSERTLSPSDFGFHNALRNREGHLIFLDFEYFGWDDPAKLVGDFLLHPAMNLSIELKREWICGAKKIYGPLMHERLIQLLPLLGLCWCLLLLNEFRRDLWVRRKRAAGAAYRDRSSILKTQLGKSHELLSQVKSDCFEALFE